MARYAVTVVQPPGYLHAAAFQEVGETLLHALAALGHDVVLGPDAPAGRTAIVLGSNLLPGHPLRLAPDAILYNLEQIEPGSPWLTPQLLALFRRHPVWDYSERNAARYAELGLDRPRVVPIGWVPELTRIPPAPLEDLDVLFYGSVNPRRLAVLDALRAAGLRVEAVFGVYGEARDRLIARAKVVLNVHYFEAKVFEVVRVSYLLANRRCVVSERGADPAEERELEAAVAFAPYQGLVETCRRLVQDPAERARRAALGFELMSRRDAAAILAPLVGGTPPVRPAASTPARPAPPPPPAAPSTAPSPPHREPSADQRSPPMSTATSPATPPLSLEDVVAMAAPAGKRILALNCGDGELGAGLLAAGALEVVGLDACARGLTRSRLTATYRVSPDAAPELPYADGYFDVLLVEDLSSLLAPGPTLQHLRRWLSDGGRLVAAAHNGSHEAALLALLGEGRWPASAGRSPRSIGTALETVLAAGFLVDDDVTVVRSAPGEAAEVLRKLCEALGAEAAKVADGLTLVRAVLTARPAEPLGQAAAALPDPWRGSRAVKVLVTPDLDNPEDAWLEAVAGLAAGLSGNAGVTLGVALPPGLLSPPPEALVRAVEGVEVDLLLTEAPVDDAGWTRLLAGAGTWIMTGPQPALLALARLVGVDVQRGA
ncbi:MAG: methyltransferase domain-containing protein [Anaeromyxobacter sp.]|nr:methyltransferase domain-containing protein [Anaeromyxobacter sp.]MBL0276777.1 methyltransferase domain-containing protein [Anaeromyxobacter sp.]